MKYLIQTFGLMALLLVLPAGAQERANGGNSLPPNTNFFITTPATFEQNLARAPIGSTLFCEAGSYCVSNLWRKSVNYHFEPGAVINFSEPSTNGPTYAVFDDRGGAVTSTVSGNLVLNYNAGTNVNYDPDDCSPHLGNANATDAIVMTNANSLVHFQADRITTFKAFTVNYAIRVDNCADGTSFDVGEILDGNPSGSLNFTNCPLDPGTVYSTVTGANAVSWGLGNLHVHIGRVGVLTGTYVLNTYGVATNDVADLHMTVDQDTHNRWYITGTSPNYRAWLHVDTAEGGDTFVFLGSGKYYLDAMKIKATFSSCIKTYTTGGINGSNLVLWANVQKLDAAASNAHWLDDGDGEIHLAVLQYEDEGGNGISTSAVAQKLYIEGGEARVTSSGVGISHASGEAHFKNFKLVQASPNTNSVATVSATGLTFQNCVLVGNGTNILYAASAKTVGIYNGLAVNKTNHVNISLSPGTNSFNVDSNAQ